MAAFNQTFNAPVGQVINATGNVILNEQSKSADLEHILTELQTSIDAQDGLSDEAKTQAKQTLAEAIAEVRNPVPDKSKTSDKIAQAANALEAGGKAATGLSALAKTLFDIGKWVAVFL